MSLSRSSGTATDTPRTSGVARRTIPVRTPPGPSSTIRVAPRPLSASREWRQRTGLQSCADSSPGHSAASVWTRASTLATTGTSGAWKVTASSRSRRRARAGSIIGVWKAPETGMGSTLRAPSSLAWPVARAMPSSVPAMTTWPGRVVVGHPDVGLGPLAGGLGVVVGDADQRGHGARPGVGRLLHGVAPLDDQRRPVGEGEGPGGHQGRVLAQAVAGTGARGESEPLHGVEHDQAHDEGGQLGVGRPGELLHGGVEQEGRQVAPGDLGGLAGHLPRGVVDPGMAHAGPLGPLSREGKGQHPRAPLATDRRSARPVDGPVCHGA